MLEQLETPVARVLLQSTIPARLAFQGVSGRPHVTAIWFVWRDGNIIVCSACESHKVKGIRKFPDVELTIDTDTVPYKSLRIRGVARVEDTDGICPEYVEAAHHYYGKELGQKWINWFGKAVPAMSRITIEPTWAHAMDFEAVFNNVFE